MRTFVLDDRLDVAIIPGHSFQFMTTATDQARALRRIRAHLVPGGELIVHVDYDSLQSLLEMDGREVLGRPLTEPSGRRFRASYAWTLDSATANATLRTAWCELGEGDAPLRRWGPVSMVLHVISAVEMEHALLRAGFIDVAVVGSFDGSPLRSDSGDMIWSARTAE